MRLWDYIFPYNKDIIICGAGKRGKEWLSFLQSIGRHVRCFFDKDAKRIGSISGVDVLPYGGDMGDSVILISFAKGAEEVDQNLRSLGYQDIRLGSILNFVPHYASATLELGFIPFGHFYSLYPDLQDVDRDYEKILRLSESIDGCDAISSSTLNADGQKAMLAQMNAMFDTIPEWSSCEDKRKSKYRYRKGNDAFGMSDSLVLHFMLRIINPSNFIEVGSGYTSAITLDTNEYYLNGRMNTKFIEPYPERLISLTKEHDDRENMIIAKKLQDVPLSFFDVLEDGDVLFIDSTHVSKVGSDVNYLFFHILPRLNAGVYVHLHDIFYPWQYPSDWIMRGMGWNEMYLLRAFLQYNDRWEIVFFNHYMATKHPKLYCEEWRGIPDLGGGSFWMRKRKL